MEEDLSYTEYLIAIADRQSRVLRNKEVGLVNVQWHRHSVDECT